jgi:VWFA-related protein
MRLLGSVRPAPPRAGWVSTCLLLIWMAGFVGTRTSEAQQDLPVLRVTTHLVEVHVLVHDKAGKPVVGLTRDDYVLKERSKPQKITAFSAQTSRSFTSTLPPNPLPPGVFSNLAPRGETPPTTATVVLLDKLNTRTKDQNYAKRELLKFLKQARPEERIAILTLGDDSKLRALADFTASAQALLHAALADPTRISELQVMSEIDPMEDRKSVV